MYITVIGIPFQDGTQQKIFMNIYIYTRASYPESDSAAVSDGMIPLCGCVVRDGLWRTLSRVLYTQQRMDSACKSCTDTHTHTHTHTRLRENKNAVIANTSASLSQDLYM